MSKTDKVNQIDAVGIVAGGGSTLVSTGGGSTSSFDTVAADAWLGGKSTDDIREGGMNLYFTDARADAWLLGKNTDNLSEGLNNLYFSDVRVSANSDVAANTALRHNPLTIGIGGLSAKLTVDSSQVLTLAAINHGDLSNINPDDHHDPVTAGNGSISVAGQILTLNMGYSNHWTARQYFDGGLDASDAEIYGQLHAAVFVKDLVSAHAGELILAKSAGTLDADFTTGGTMIIKDPPTGGWLFDDNDIIRIKAETGTGVSESWLQVTRTATTNQYTTSLLSGDSATYFAGTGLVDYGQSGDGVIRLDATGADTPKILMQTHNGTPYSSMQNEVVLGDLSGVTDAIFGSLSGYGLYADNVYLRGRIQVENVPMYAISGDDWSAWQVSTNATIAQDTDTHGGTYAVLGTSAITGASSSGQVGDGQFGFQIPASNAVLFSGKRIIIEFWAKQPATGSASQIAAAYSTNSVGNSGWFYFNPTTSWAKYSFYYDVPADNVTADYLKFWGDTSGGGGGVLIDDVTIYVVPDGSTLTNIDGGSITTGTINVNNVKLVGGTTGNTIAMYEDNMLVAAENNGYIRFVYNIDDVLAGGQPNNALSLQSNFNATSFHADNGIYNGDGLMSWTLTIGGYANAVPQTHYLIIDTMSGTSEYNNVRFIGSSSGWRTPQVEVIVQDILSVGYDNPVSLASPAPRGTVNALAGYLVDSAEVIAADKSADFHQLSINGQLAISEFREIYCSELNLWSQTIVDSTGNIYGGIGSFSGYVDAVGGFRINGTHGGIVVLFDNYTQVTGWWGNVGTTSTGNVITRADMGNVVPSGAYAVIFEASIRCNGAAGTTNGIYLYPDGSTTHYMLQGFSSTQNNYVTLRGAVPFHNDRVLIDVRSDSGISVEVYLRVVGYMI